MKKILSIFVSIVLVAFSLTAQNTLTAQAKKTAASKSTKVINSVLPKANKADFRIIKINLDSAAYNNGVITQEIFHSDSSTTIATFTPVYIPRLISDTSTIKLFSVQYSIEVREIRNKDWKTILQNEVFLNDKEIELDNKTMQEKIKLRDARLKLSKQ